MPLPLIPSNQMQPVNPDVSLDQALQMFQGTVQRAGLVRALQEANEQVNQVQESAIKEQEKMAAMNQIARGLAFQMMATGSNSAQIEQAAGMIKPRQIQTADEAILRGSLAGDQDLIQRGLLADRLSAANKLALLEGRGQRSGTPLVSAEMNTIQGFDTAVGDLENLMGQLDMGKGDTGPIAGRLPDLLVSGDTVGFRAGVLQFFNEYKRSMTGQAAGLKEMRDIQASIPKLTDTPSDFKKKAEKTIEAIKRHKQSYLKVLKAGKKDVSGYESVMDQEAAAQAALPKAEAWRAFAPKGK